jgi:hypothetical protein
MSVRGIPWAFLSLHQVALNRLFIGAVRLAILPDASLASRPQGFQAFGLGAFGFALCFVLGHGFGAFGGSLPISAPWCRRPTFAPIEFRDTVFIQQSLPVCDETT